MSGNKKEIRCLELHVLNYQNNVLTPALINKLHDRDIYVALQDIQCSNRKWYYNV